MQEKEGKPQNQFKSTKWLRIILAYVVTYGGILALCWLAAFFLKFWSIGLLLIVVITPLFPAMQTVLLRKKSARLFMKVYVAEFASLTFQLAFLLASAPFIAIAVAGMLACVLLFTAVIMWFIVGLQQLGLEIGSKMSRVDIEGFFWATIGLVVAVGIYYICIRLFKKYGDSYVDLWAKQFVNIREFFRHDIL